MNPISASPSQNSPRKKKGAANGNGDASAALNKPRVIIATRAELDAELPDALQQHVETVKGVRASFAALDATYDAEKKAAEKRIADEKKKSAKSTAPAAAAKPAPATLATPKLTILAFPVGNGAP